MLSEATAIKASLINEPIAPFNLESNKGGTKNLANLKGKIVVLDFWATWCAPCKAAMPGMAMVVDKYKNDTSTAFFFVSTLETLPDYKTQIAKFLKEKKYPFEVLYDAYNTKTEHLDKTYDTYAKAFHFSGIPQKMIIDADGKLRWRSTGYYGSPSALADEISTVIETLKKEEETKKSKTYWQGNIGTRRVLLENQNDSLFITVPEMNINRQKATSVIRVKDSISFDAGYWGKFKGFVAPDGSSIKGTVSPQLKPSSNLILTKVRGSIINKTMVARIA